MVVGRNNGVVGLTGFSDKKMSGLLFGPQKSGRNNGVVVWRGSTVQVIFSKQNRKIGLFLQFPMSFDSFYHYQWFSQKYFLCHFKVYHFCIRERFEIKSWQNI